MGRGFSRVSLISGDPMKDLFLLDPDVVYLNHGSFGACPRPVFEAYQRWQLELERQPVAFLGRRAPQLLSEARTALAGYLGCTDDEVVYFPNPTTALNMVAHSLALGTGDEILASDHEYGAMDRTWRFLCSRSGAEYIQAAIPLPLSDPGQVVDALWNYVSERTRAIFLSHITSPTAIRFPVEEVCRRARQEGILTIIDGAHAPGQLELDLNTLGADFYAGACHKWLCAPKGASFLYARREAQDLLEPLVVSWGWEAEKPGPSLFIDHHEWQGTRDLAAFLSVPDAIAFQREHDWPAVRQRCHQLALDLRQRLLETLGLPGLTPAGEGWFIQMFAVPLPELDPQALQRTLLEEHNIEVVARRWNRRPLLRVSVQAYNDEIDCSALESALKLILT
ncbi:MAG: aminotransferase class V-fold PLP-dependent enzyme [Anaerolineales bacterium]|nr:MAG: aminotransferase class V-fold PLP-dependent enzyme [Anaerolineales bacterium]